MRKQSLLLLLQMGIFASLGNAQNVTASITGTVTDSTGATIPNAKVVATNAGTALTHTAQTNGAGVYNLPFLPVGSYNILAENSGFKRATLGPFTLEVNQIARVDFALKIGAVACLR